MKTRDSLFAMVELGISLIMLATGQYQVAQITVLYAIFFAVLGIANKDGRS